LNNLYNSGVDYRVGRHIFGMYFLFGNNCTTTVCSALQAGGNGVPTFIVPASLYQFLHNVQRMQDGWNSGGYNYGEPKF